MYFITNLRKILKNVESRRLFGQAIKNSPVNGKEAHSIYFWIYNRIKKLFGNHQLTSTIYMDLP